MVTFYAIPDVVSQIRHFQMVNGS